MPVKPTGKPCHSTIQSGSSCSDLVGPSLPQGPHSELEGAPRDMLAPVFNIDNVRSHFLRDKADAVGAVLSFDDLCVLRLPCRTRHLSCHLLVPSLTCKGVVGGGVNSLCFLLYMLKWAYHQSSTVIALKLSVVHSAVLEKIIFELIHMKSLRIE